MDEGMQRRLAVAQDYPMMMGLASLVTGFWMIVGGVSGQSTYFAIGAVFAASAMGWYEKRYGKVRQRTANMPLTIVAAVLAAAAIMMLIGLDGNKPQPILLAPLLGSVIIAAVYRYSLRHVGLTVWHWLAFALLLAASFLPLLGWRPHFLQEVALAAPTLMITGIVDHLRLVRALGKGGAPVEEPR